MLKENEVVLLAKAYQRRSSIPTLIGGTVRLLVPTVVGFCEICYVPKTTNGVKGSFGEAQIPVRKVMPWQEDASQRVIGSNTSVSSSYLFVHNIRVS